MWVLAAVKAWLAVDTSDDDALIQGAMDRALESVERELDWHFGAAEAVEEILSGTGQRALWIRQPPIGGDPVVSVRSTVGGTWETVSTDDYETIGRGFFNVGNWTLGVRNYRVAYSQGFAQVPGDIEALLLELVAGWYDNRGVEGVKSERIGDYAYTLGDLQATEGWASVVMNWRRGKI